MIKSVRKKTIATCAVMAGLLVSLTGFTANAASSTTYTATGTYTNAYLVETPDTDTTIKAFAKGKNKTDSTKYMEVYLKRKSGSTYSVIQSSKGTTGAGTIRTTSESYASADATMRAVSTIHSGTSVQTSELETKMYTH